MFDYQFIRWDKTEPPDSNELRKQMESEDFNVYQWSDSAGAVYLEHFHSNDQSHWIISGSLVLNLRDVGVFVLNAGDRDFMPANTYHSAKVLGDESVVYLIGEKN